MNSTTRTVSIITTLLGVVILLGLAVSAASPFAGRMLAGPPAPGGTHMASLEGVTNLRIDSQQSRVTIAFDDVPEAELSSTSEDSTWALRTSGQTLTATNARPFGGACFFWCGPRDEEVTLTLPTSAEGRLDGAFDLASGSLAVDGDFSRLAVEVGAGTFTYAGAVADLDVDLSAGTANIDAEGTNAARLTVAAGRMDAQVTGAAPEQVGIDVAAGRLDLTLPDETYEVATDLAFGQFENGLRTDPGSEHRIDVEMAAGRIVLRPAG